jgi:hypothetical protein
MRRVFRWLFNGATASSLLLCATTAILWVRSYQCNDGIAHTHFKAARSGAIWSAASNLGKATFYCQRFTDYTFDDWICWSAPASQQFFIPAQWSVLGFTLGRTPERENR